MTTMQKSSAEEILKITNLRVSFNTYAG